MNRVQMRHGRRKVESGRRVTGATSLVNARSLQLECARVFHETLLVVFLTFDRDGEGEV